MASAGGWGAPAAAGGGGGAASVCSGHSHRSGHSDEPEECRFFNSPNGCREGTDCPYKHVERALSEIPCRFNGTAPGSKPAFGKRCPHKPRAVAKTKNRKIEQKPKNRIKEFLRRFSRELKALSPNEC